MFLMINDKRYSVSRRIKQGDTVKYLSVSPAVEDISGTVKLFRDDGLLLSEDNAEDYARRFMVGTLLTMTNQPEPMPAPVSPSLEEEMAAAIREGVDSV